jgi:hypothetical protein
MRKFRQGFNHLHQSESEDPMLRAYVVNIVNDIGHGRDYKNARRRQSCPTALHNLANTRIDSLKCHFENLPFSSISQQQVSFAL